jgi:hypothetical protein
MNWYKKAQSEINKEQLFLSGFKPQSLKGLAGEALKCNTIEEFENDFLGQIKHGTYWHITDNPNFTIDPLKGPRDLSSMAVGEMTAGKLMVTTHLENWIPYFEERPYVAEIDMSMVDRKDYYQVKRGFGNEFMITNPSKARVVRVLPVKSALRVDRYVHGKIPQSFEELRKFFESVKTQYSAFLASEGEKHELV